MNREHWIRALRVAGIVLAISFLVHSLVAAGRELNTFSGEVSWLRVGVAVLVLTGTYLGFAWLWRRIAQDLGTRVAYVHAVQLWAFSNLGRYLPGKIWQVVGLVVVAKDLGVSGALAASVAIVALGFTIATGSLLAAICLPGYVLGHPWLIGFALASLVALAVPLLWPGAVRWSLSRFAFSRDAADAVHLSHRDTARLAASFALMWLSHGLTFMLLVSAVVSVDWSRYTEYAGVFSLSYVAGVIAIFAPGGIGVRESALAHVMQAQQLHPESANIIAILARIWTVLGEVLMVVIAVFVRRRSSGRL
ncbi:MAG: hypothetical protein DHS20C21_02250 [Gemmatimonadota bacterium]|nr:MAG: hypothetical protein DHS20C21_02250 [Gemmatimonadota bacterium]